MATITNGIYDFDLPLGADQSYVFTYSPGGTPANITGATIALQARESYASTTAALSLSTPSSGIALTTPASGVFTVTFGAAATSALDYRTQQKLVYDIEMTLSGTKTRIVRGTITCIPEATRV